jgi:DNA-binding transcriptional MerR regulator
MTLESSTRRNFKLCNAFDRGQVSMTDLSIVEMCDRFGVTRRLIVFYEEKELLAPRRCGRQRLYGPEQIAIMERLVRWRAIGLELETMRRILVGAANEEKVLRIRRQAIFAELAHIRTSLALVSEALGDRTGS